MKRPLTDLTIQSLPFGNQYAVWDDLPCFGVRVGRRTKTFVLKQRNRYHVLGRYPLVTLKQARDEARRRLRLQYFPETSLRTHEAVERYLEAKKDEHRPSTRRVFTLYLKRLDNRPLNELTAAYVYHTIQSLPKSAANLAFAACKAFLSWCVERDYIVTNPLQAKKQPHRRRSRDRLLSDGEIRLIWNESYNHNSFGVIVRVLILTGQRLAQINSFETSWTHRSTIVFPAYIMKSNAEHIIPLTSTAAAHTQPLTSPSKSISAAMGKFRAALPTLPHWTLHDFRRYFSSTMAKLAVPIDITEALLAHTAGSRNEIQRTYDRYNRLDPMRDALEKYERHLFATVLEERS